MQAMKYECSQSISHAEMEFVSELPSLSSSSAADLTRMRLNINTDADSITAGAQTDLSCHVTKPIVSSWPGYYLRLRVTPPPSYKRIGMDMEVRVKCSARSAKAGSTLSWRSNIQLSWW